jgi:anti-sigma regulatory factor (Ser/Thr protein kinase)
MNGDQQRASRSRASDALTMRLAGGAEAAAGARAALARLHSDLDPPLIENMRLLVTELIANSVKHADAEHIALKVVVGSRAVLVEVADEGPGFQPSGRLEDQDQSSGWGLFLVDRLADRWGVARENRGTRVWFELRRG